MFETHLEEVEIMVVNGKDRETLQMGMKTENIWFKTPKINPQSNPNKFGGEKCSKITWRSSEWWSLVEKLREKLVARRNN